MECLSQIPYTSIIGFISVMIGCAVTSATLYDSINRTDELLSKYFFKINFLSKALVIFTVMSVILVIICIFVLIFAFIATLTTRNKVYHRSRCILGGRRTAAILMCLLFIANVTWIGVMCLLMVPVLGWMMISTTCRYEISQYQHTSLFSYNFSLNNYGIYSDYWQSDNVDQIKPENLLINHDSELKLADFGWSIHTNIMKRKTMCGTLNYLPPEIVNSQVYNERIDHWMTGILLYEMLTGSPPFERDNGNETTKPYY